MLIGMGYDVHRLVPGQSLVIGGVKIPFNMGLLGHSDADVLTHAVCDAVLGAAGLGDIGIHFPDTNPEFKNIDSIKLLNMIHKMIAKKKMKVVNIDSTVIAQAPRISPYRKKMAQNIANALRIDPYYVNIKGTTTEKLGFTGKGEGIAAMAVVLLENKET